MTWRTLPWLTLPFLTALPPMARADEPKAEKKIGWKKIVVDKAFRSEGVAVADVNKDGKKDVLVGDVWYEGPDFKKIHVIREDRKYDGAKGYSKSFGCWADDFNKDGWPDLVVVPFPGEPGYWYENPKNKPGPWKQHEYWHSVCNETPTFVDLFKDGKKGLLMGWQPKGQNNMGQMSFFRPGEDPTKPWTMYPISVPSEKGKEVPSTQRFSHGLGVGDLNGDGRSDVICPGGWWAQPEKYEGQPWKFHPAGLGPLCADMFAQDLDGDGKNDVISSAAHDIGFWWHQRQPKGDFVKRDLFPTPASLAVVPKEVKLSADEETLFKAINAHRVKTLLVSPLPGDSALVRAAQATAKAMADKGNLGVSSEASLKFVRDQKYTGAAINSIPATGASVEELIKSLTVHLGGPVIGETEMGIGVAKGKAGALFAVLILGNHPGRFVLPGQTHALHHVDMDGDGLKDLVTGRRFWAHGPKGDNAPNDPAFLYWFKARKSKDGVFSFEPHLIDDASGIGTQFEIIDVDGDGVPDVVVSNKKGTFVFLQTRGGAVEAPARKD